jgi:quinol monooxygenase YgiN
MTQHSETAFIVVDIWRAKPGQQQQLDQLLADSAAAFRQQPGVLSVDFTRLEDDPERYLVVFRYQDAQAREDFVATPQLKATLSALSEFWDLESPIYKGIPLEN